MSAGGTDEVRVATDEVVVAAVDVGATSGRVITGHLADGRFRLTEVHRFPNTPLHLPGPPGGSLHWNLPGLFTEIVRGLVAAERANPGRIDSVGIDSWAVDYGLLRQGRLLGLPHHYRDSRTAVGVERVLARVSSEELYARTGLQHLPFTTIFQLACEPDLVGFADQMLLMPDLLGYWLTGEMVAERTNASTTGLLGATTGEWDLRLVDQVGASGLLPDLVNPGTRLGRLLPASSEIVGRALDVVSVGSHDTASAVAAIPAADDDVAYISCGTWGLVGLDLPAPVLTDAARRANFTNERGIDGSSRFLRNVMGLWLLTECVRAWEPRSSDEARAALLADLVAAVSAGSWSGPLLDVDDPVFAAPASQDDPVPNRISTWHAERGLRAPRTPDEVVACVVASLAQAYADTVALAARLAGRRVQVIHLVGGGAKNRALCQAVADRSGLVVKAGPVEATALGNLLVQARALGAIDSTPEAMRRVAVASSGVVTYRPGARVT